MEYRSIHYKWFIRAVLKINVNGNGSGISFCDQSNNKPRTTPRKPTVSPSDISGSLLFNVDTLDIFIEIIDFEMVKKLRLTAALRPLGVKCDNIMLILEMVERQF